ncbi:efflux RND transporter periplasmic adaptor subunit [Flavobacterium jejuense]|uniref:Efflux RND transporter periplasmic adaptor subunit n=1 Tax=Flavobacterium jejuense TaxID=1544455 RepID=A0ABX0IS03_9FLAO|nr:efflux RND transporter periplasmic adaptor subunit [Flavobacterium jejuense]NHN25870.1 efflux RND transporter periplasmic adaptor subunit [Flavobacterium jejuense]
MKKIRYILVLTLILNSCKNKEVEVEKTIDEETISVTKEQFQSSQLEISSPIELEFNVGIKATGKIDVPPENRVKITSFLGGYVKTTHLLIGDKVKKGQALVTLENTEFIDIQKEYLEVAEQISYLKSEYERQKTLYDEKITSQKSYLKAESDYKRANGMYQSLKKKLEVLNISPAQVLKGNLTSQITIYAPIAGDVTVVNATIGMFMSPADVILEIVDTDHLHVELAVFEKDILKIRTGQSIEFTVPQASKEVFKAEVVLVGKSIEGNDRTIMIHGHLDKNIKQRLLTGMFVEATILTDSKKGLAIPIDALITENDKNYVLLLKSNSNEAYIFEKVPVIIGERLSKEIEITENKKINKESKILTKGVFDIY